MTAQTIRNHTHEYRCTCGYSLQVNGNCKRCARCGAPVTLVQLDHAPFKRQAERDRIASLELWHDRALALHPDLYGLEL